MGNKKMFYKIRNNKLRELTGWNWTTEELFAKQVKVKEDFTIILRNYCVKVK